MTEKTSDSPMQPSLLDFTFKPREALRFHFALTSLSSTLKQVQRRWSRRQVVQPRPPRKLLCDSFSRLFMSKRSLLNHVNNRHHGEVGRDDDDYDVRIRAGTDKGDLINDYNVLVTNLSKTGVGSSLRRSKISNVISHM